MEYLKSDPMFFGYGSKKYKDNWDRMFGTKDQKDSKKVKVKDKEEECPEEK